jgi:hypothetical protein
VECGITRNPGNKGIKFTQHSFLQAFSNVEKGTPTG